MAIMLTRIANNVEAVEAQVPVEPIEVQAPIVIEVEATAYCACRECCGIWADTDYLCIFYNNYWL